MRKSHRFSLALGYMFSRISILLMLCTHVICSAAWGQELQWREVLAEPPQSVITHLAVSGESYYGLSSRNVLYRSSNGISWDTLQTSIQGGTSDLHIGLEGTIYVAARDGLYRSDDSGQTWSNIFPTSNFPFSAILAQDTSFVLAGHHNLQRILRSDGHTQNWDVVFDTGELGRINVFQTDREHRLYVGLTVGITEPMQGAIYRSADRGLSWTNLFETTTIETLAVKGDGVLYAGTQTSPGGVWRSQDDGDTWIPTSFSGPPTALATTSGGSLFVGTLFDGVWHSVDQGETWDQIGFSGQPIEDMVLGTDRHLYVAAGGLYRTEDVVTTATEAYSENEKSAVSLLASYPNPFTTSTTIAYTLSEGSRVEIRVFDVLGREVKMLVRGYQSPGTRSIVFPADGLPSGMYLYRLEAGGSIQTGTIQLIN